jgi:RNA-directed DNA polymerase
MRTYKNLYPQITDWHNLMLAWRKARKGKRYTPAAASFERNLDLELVNLHHDLLDKSYEPGEYVSFIVHESNTRRLHRGLPPGLVPGLRPRA